nr:hypothetical protein [uncultured Pedobacter sp.]
MKKILIAGLASLILSDVNAQDNLYPSTGNTGIGTLSPQSYFHGGNNKVLEVLNSNTALHSQSHIILSTGATQDQSSAGTVTWISKNSSQNKGMAYIAVQSVGDNSVNASGKMYFATADATTPTTRMVIDSKGLVGIGTINPSEKLSVNGKIRAQEIKVEAGNWPDYVFGKDYKILGLQELDAYIKANKHLPEMPSAKEVEANGMALGELVKLQQKKIEELTLHLIEKDKQVAVLEKKAANTEKVLFEINKVLDKGRNKNKTKK